MSPGAASHGHPFVISLSPSLSRSRRSRLCLPSPSPFLSLSFSLHPRPLPPCSPFPPPPPPPPTRGLALYTHAKHPVYLIRRRVFRSIAKTHPLLSIFRDARSRTPRTKTRRSPRCTSTPLPSLPISVSASPRAGFSLLAVRHTVFLSHFPPPSRTRSFLASAESPPTGVTTIDYRRVWGTTGGIARGGRVG